MPTSILFLSFSLFVRVTIKFVVSIETGCFQFNNNFDSFDKSLLSTVVSD